RNGTAAALSNVATAAAGVGLQDIQTAAQKFVSKFLSQIDTMLQQSPGDFGSKTGVKIGLITDEINTLTTQMNAYAATTGGVIDATLTQFQDEIASLQQTNAGLIKDLAQFTTLKAQYGASIAEQL